MSTITQHKEKCYHCGDDCIETTIKLEEKAFCCEGCKTVYEILNEHELDTYYNLESKPGINLKAKSNNKSRFNYLDEPQIINQLANFQSDNQIKIRFHIPQIHCASCVWLLENLYKLSAGVTESKVNFLKREAFISFNPNVVSLKQVVELLASIGYEPNLSLNDSNKKEAKDNKKLIYKIGVAGFCFGNIMLFSFPEYLAINDVLDHRYYKFFGYLNILLSIPVVFFSGNHYLKSAFLSLKKKTLNIDVPIALGISVLFIRSVLEITLSWGAGYLDSLAGLVFLLLVGRWFQNKTYQTLSFERDYKSYFPLAITKKTDAGESSISINKIQKGDVIVIHNAELIPCDAILLSDTAKIDYSFVTGESDAIDKNNGALLYAGGKLVGQSIELLVQKPVSSSYLTQLWNDESFTKEKYNSLSELTDKAGRIFTPSIIVVALVTLVYWSFFDIGIAVNAFTAVLIIACPCALALAVPFTLGNAMRLLGRVGFYIKNTQVIEKLAKTNYWVFDKTGTITINNNYKIKYHGTSLSDNDKLIIATLTKHSTHPISKKIFEYLSIESTNNTKDYKELTGQGIEGYITDKHIKIGNADFVGVEGNGTWVAIDATIKGYFDIEHSFRKGLQNLINTIGNKFKIAVITGDSERDKNKLEEVFTTPNIIYYQQSPQNKLQFIKNLQNKSNKVVMVGDGLNDSGALKQSDVGIVVTDDINNFSPASDAILAGNSFNRLFDFYTYGRRSILMVYIAFAISLAYNVIGLFFAIQGLLTPLVAAILMPLSSITVVVFGTISTLIIFKHMFKKI